MERIFHAVLAGEEDVARVLQSDPLAPRSRASCDVLVESIPHWLYAGDTALHLAAAALQQRTVELLLDAGADSNAVNRRGATPLHYACDPRPASAGTRDPPPVPPGARGPRPTSPGAWDPSTQAAVIDCLAAHGADVNHADRGGATPLHRAVRARSVTAVRQLLALGARTDARLRTRGSSPLHLATQSTGAGGTAGSLDAQLEIIALLRKNGADVAAVDISGRTPHDWARNAHVAAALATGSRATPSSKRAARRTR